jgi:hypothetical protein
MGLSISSQDSLLDLCGPWRAALLAATAAGRVRSRGVRCPGFWPGVWSAGPWLGASRASRKARNTGGQKSE